MIKTALLRLPTPPAAPPPPPPPPPPPSEIQVKPKNGSSSGGAKWTLRTETRNGSDKNSMMTRAEGTVEIPKPQSVASLREQIARKLEVKMLSAQPAPNGASMAIGSSRTRPPLWISSLNGQYPCVPQHSNASSFQHLAPKMSKPSSNSQSSNHTTLQKQISIVHEPMERHVSCITPVPFNRAATLSSVIIAPNTSNISSNNTTVAPTSSDIFLPPPVIHGENNDYKCFSANGKAASSQLSSYQKVNLVKEGAENGVQSSLPLTTPVANGTINLHRSSVSENTASDPPVLNPPSFFVNAHRTVRNETAIKDLEISASANHDDAVPSSNLSAADTVQELGSQFGASSSSIVTTSRSQREMLPLSKPVELRTEIQPEMLPLSKPVELRTEIQRETDHLHQLKSEQQNLTTTAMLKTYNNRQCTQEGKPQGTSATVPRNDTHTENSSWYRTMFKKMHVVDQLGKFFYVLVLILKDPH
ncbi:unnamed protein product [Litomosoides sigmodontis]|uniref:Uncharacterized protein n=1 Tax=Litomosoides sigmodontis TaxID=42156 RepID=A0A3P6V0J4_LITSI|nr:unnamed protein product [Litomosoides sigmodontis]